VPVKTNNPTSRKHSKHYAKVYWPYLPLVLIVGVGLWLGHPSSERAQRGTLDYAINVNDSQLLTSANRQRASHGQTKLQVSSDLSNQAKIEAQNIATSNNLEVGQLPNQTVAYGFDSSDQAVKGWLNSAKSREVLLNQNYQEVGFGTAQSQNFQGQGPTTVIVAVYGSPTSSVGSAIATPANSSPLLNNSVTSISKIQTLTDGRMPWIGLAVAILGVACIAFLVIKHGYSARHSWKKGEKFVLSHPVLDVTLIALAAVCALLCQNVGFIG
jgi:uncharacterized protein YkwD